MSDIVTDDPQAWHAELRQAVRQLCARFPDEYWRRLDREEAYPTDFVQAMTAAGYLAALIPEAYGGIGVGLVEA
ncbi:MAG: acyl-CoA dehydrogenase family protein, partial [Anaerolineales bacterium]|nr:acyl-CoA dehydrogenase family protein [Anaerolineales bacterium]